MIGLGSDKKKWTWLKLPHLKTTLKTTWTRWPATNCSQGGVLSWRTGPAGVPLLKNRWLAIRLLCHKHWWCKSLVYFLCCNIFQLSITAFHLGILFQLSNEAYQQPEQLYNDGRLSFGAGHHQVNNMIIIVLIDVTIRFVNNIIIPSSFCSSSYKNDPN